MVASFFPFPGMHFIREGSDTPKFTRLRRRQRRPGLASAWLGGGRERERVDEPPLAHARSYVGDEESGGDLASKWFDQMPRSLESLFWPLVIKYTVSRWGG